ncbi:MAG: helix-turn-helix transcriptional regulator, partial [Alphaproteobacteria bacterium]|nr:helix-turn-helix transcriptional regulator [Alphaproteobacteria bacterium]
TAHKVELQSLNPDHAIRDIDLEDVAWIARVIWASQ